MKTIIEWKERDAATIEGVAPSINPECKSFDLIDDENVVHDSDIEFSEVRRVVFEPGE